MSAFGTKKQYGSEALQATFPDVAAAIRVETDNTPYGYIGRAMIGKAELPVANDFQQSYHEEKKRWADAKALEWVHNNARTRWLMNHNTFGYTQPYASLGQRIFANPSLGNISDIYAARDDIADHMLYERRNREFSPAEHADFERQFIDLVEQSQLVGGERRVPGWDWFYNIWDKFSESAFGQWLGQNGWKLLATAGDMGGMPGGDQLVEKAEARQNRIQREKEKLEREERERESIEDRSRPAYTPPSTQQRKEASAAKKASDAKAKAEYEAARNKKTGKKGGLHGGVLRTAEGQRYGRQLLRDRIAQLNIIEANRPGITENPFGPVAFPREPTMIEAPLTKDDERMLQLRSLLETITGTYEENRELDFLSVNTLSVLLKTASEAIKILTTLAVDFSNSDFNDVLNLLLDAEFAARSDFTARLNFEGGELTNTIARLYSSVYAMIRFTEGMFGVTNSTREEKLAKARQLIKSIGLVGKLPDYTPNMGEFAEGERGEIRITPSTSGTIDQGIAPSPDNFIGQGRRKRVLGRLRKLYGGADPCASYPEWEYRPVSNYYKPGDKVMYKGKAYECVSNTTNPPLRTNPSDPNVGKVQSQWKEIPCGEPGKETTLDPNAIQPVVVLPQQSGFDFTKGEAQPFNPPPPAVPRQPYLIPEEPEGKVEKVKSRTPMPPMDRKEFPALVKFDVDQRVKFGDSQGAYYGEKIGERVPVAPVPIPIEPDGSLVHPGSGYTRPTFPKFAVQKKPSNSLLPRQKAALPMFQETAKGIFSAKRMPNAPVTSVPIRTPFSFVGGDITRKTLPKTVEGFMELAKKLEGSGTKIAVRPTSKLASIRATFIRKLGL